VTAVDDIRVSARPWRIVHVPRIVMLLGAKKNVGDYLIGHRAVALVQELVPGAQIRKHSRWDPLEPSSLSGDERVVLGGGPGLATDMYPGIFPLTRGGLEELRVPVVPLALGWSGVPKGQPESFRFTPESVQALKRFHADRGWLSVRDDVSVRILERHGIEARCTGCVVWYLPPSEVTATEAVKDEPDDVVVTAPGRMDLFWQCAQLLSTVAKRFPGARRRLVFHRGIRSDALTARRAAVFNRSLALHARSLGYEVVDAAYKLSAIDFYRTADLHVGYRVHAHLAFLSNDRPSILISEDGRGVGQQEALGDPWSLEADDDSVLRGVAAAVDQEVRDGWPALAAARQRIEASRPVMMAALEKLA
jgi:hypothetical protein